MKIYEDASGVRLKERSRAIAIGVFDGVHRGHRKILRQMLRHSRRFGLVPMAVTFDPHPLKVLARPKKHEALMSLSHRLRLFEKMGIAETFVIRFTRAFSGMSRGRFLSDLLLGRLGLGALSVGYDFRFGRGGLGDLEFLRKESRERKFHFSASKPLKVAGRIISSTEIRRLIVSGDLRMASRMLGRPVSVYGTVIHGRGRGGRRGFPTANLNPHHETIPPAGVYAVRGDLGGRWVEGVLHIGPRPTYDDRQRSVEVHFLNFSQGLYGKDVELVFLKKLRPIRKFKDPLELAQAIKKDILRAGRLFTLQKSFLQV
ncbi:MAG: riboflavin biosynthesis protein RibF [Candidatus Omnitrophica bacterium]|nr:riboflavin biosynthesis protein RibF [Candidatus Omnitrophota bacterium]